MPEIRDSDIYILVAAKDSLTLQTRYDELNVALVGTDYRALDADRLALYDEQLTERLAIARELRKRAAVGTRKSGSPKTPKPKADKGSLADLL
jgi:hypothetical protein